MERHRQPQELIGRPSPVDRADHFYSLAQSAFCATIAPYGGSLILASYAFQILGADLARIAGLFELIPISHVPNFDEISVDDEDMLSFVMLEEFLHEIDLLEVDILSKQDELVISKAITRLRRNQPWGLHDCTTFAVTMERAALACHQHSDREGLASDALEALDCALSDILHDDIELEAEVTIQADAQTDRFHTHIDTYGATAGPADLLSIALGDRISPAEAAGKLLATGLMRPESFDLDAIFDPVTRRNSFAYLDRSIRENFADLLDVLREQSKRRDDIAFCHLASLRVMMRAQGVSNSRDRETLCAAIRQARRMIEEITPAPASYAALVFAIETQLARL